MNEITPILLSAGVSPRQAEMFEIYAQMLIEWNKKINLTAITEPRDIAVRHFLDSISPLEAAEIHGEIADVGTGAGFPSIPMKIMRPELRLALIDSLAKRINFLEKVISELGLENITLLHMRAEDAGRDKKLRGHFDICVSRAVANMATLSELCIPLLKKQGRFIALKGPLADTELENAKKAIKELGGEIEGINEVDIPQSDLKHKIVMIKKVRQTAEIYPRKAPLPSKKPII